MGGAKELFDFDKDIESINVNRWAHGYTANKPRDSLAIGTQPLGHIAIANND